MISLTCTHCKTVLNIDDAFAGGVCRCQHCGTIQTVPSHLKPSGGASPQTGAAPSAKLLYQHRNRAEVGTGLDDLADVVASSGLSSGGLGTGSHASRQSTAVTKANRTQTTLAVAGTVIVLLLIAVVWLAIRQSGTPVGTGEPTSPIEAPTSAEPTFLGIALKGDTIVYVLDRGGGTQKAFGDLKEATLRSLATLGPNRKFQVIFWNNGTDESFPSGSSTYATRPNLEAARRTLDGVSAFGATNVSSAMTKAMTAKPDLIILATGKAWDLDGTFVKSVMDLRKDSDAPIHAIAIGGSDGSDAFSTLAKETGGEFLEISEGELRQRVR